MKKGLLLLPIFFLLTGCYNYRELNDLAIVSGISIDKNGDTFQVTTEIVNPKKQQDVSSGKETDFVIYTSTGSSMQEAFRSIVKESPKKLYGAQMEVLIITEEMAKENLKDILDFFARDPELRSEFYVLIAENTDTLEITTPLDNLSTKDILSSLEANNNYLGVANLVTFHELLDNYLNPNIELALPSVETVGNETAGETNENLETTTSDAANIIKNIAVFKSNQFIGYLSEKESLAYNITMGNSKTFLMKSQFEEKEYVINEILESSPKIEIDIKQKKITISIEGKAAIAEANYSGDLEDTKTIEKIQKKLNNDVEELISNSIESITQTYNSDIFGFRDLFYKKDSKAYQEIKDSWYEEIFPNLEIEVKSEIVIFEKGNLNGGLHHE